VAKAPKRAFVCNECGADYPRWQGQCSACHAWNTITEVRVAASPTVARNERLSGYAGNAGVSKVQKLSEISLEALPRFSTGFKEFDRVLGGGVVGLNAARMAVGLGAEVVVLERSIPRMRHIDEVTGGRVITRYSSLHAIEEELPRADVVIGAVLTPGAEAPTLVRRDQLASMKKDSVLIDVAIDQGGCFETSRPTTHDDPTYVVDGVIHYCVGNMPGAVPRTSSEALNNATLPYGLALADQGLEALRADPHLARGLNVLKGQITHPAVGKALDMAWSDPFDVWAEG